MKGNFPNLVKEIDEQVQVPERIPNKMDTKRPTQRHIIIKMLKVKDKENIKSSKRKAVTYRGIPISLSVYFSKETCRLKGIGKKYSKS